jgi:hypothetical protein
VLLPSHHRFPASAGARRRLPVGRIAAAADAAGSAVARLVVLPRHLGPGSAVETSAAPPGESKSVTAVLGPLRRVNPSQ